MNSASSYKPGDKTGNNPGQREYAPCYVFIEIKQKPTQYKKSRTVGDKMSES